MANMVRFCECGICGLEVKGLNRNTLQPIRFIRGHQWLSGRINYNFYNLCRKCELKLPKIEVICHKCHMPVRKKANHERGRGQVYY